MKHTTKIPTKKQNKYKKLAEVLETLKYAKNIGETNAEEIDKYLYSENHHKL